MSLSFRRNTFENTSTAVLAMAGVAGRTYNVSIRVQAVCALKTHTGGSVVGTYARLGGTPASDNSDQISLVIASPSATYYLNVGTTDSPAYNSALDYTFTTQAVGQTTLTLNHTNEDYVQFSGDVNGNLIPVTGVGTINGCWAKITYTILSIA